MLRSGTPTILAGDSAPQVSNAMNDRPLGVQSSGENNEGEVLPISPNTLILGRSSKQPSSLIDADDENQLVRRVKFVEEVERSWWYQRLQENAAFPMPPKTLYLRSCLFRDSFFSSGRRTYLLLTSRDF